MDIKTSIFDVISEIQKDLEDVFARIGIILKIRNIQILSRI
jgi:hypothetical protein